MNMNRMKVMLYLLTATSVFSTAFGQSLLSSLSVTLCGIVAGIQLFIGILAIALFLIGGVLYAVAHFIPTSVDFRKSMQTWATAMIIGGIIGLIVVIIAQPLVTLIGGFSSAAGGGFTVGTC